MVMGYSSGRLRIARAIGAVRFGLWTAIGAASVWWAAWWIVSSGGARADDGPAKAAAARLGSDLSGRPFRPSADVPAILAVHLGLSCAFSASALASDGKDGPAFFFQALPFIVVAVCSYGLIALDRQWRCIRTRCGCGCCCRDEKKKCITGRRDYDDDDGTTISAGDNHCPQSPLPSIAPRLAAPAASCLDQKYSIIAHRISGSVRGICSGIAWITRLVAAKARLTTTYPMVVTRIIFPGRVGIDVLLTAAEAAAAVAFLALLGYVFGRRTYLDFIELDLKYAKLASHSPLSKRIPLHVAKLGKASYNLARTALIPFALMWVPVTRGSPMLRVLGIPPERAARYHTWLATAMLVMLAGHGAGYTIFYVATGRAAMIMSWETGVEYSCAVAAGPAALAVGLAMAAAARRAVRRRRYELFRFTHVALSPVFVALVVHHAVWTLHLFIAPVLLFLADRLLRLVQSHRSAPLVSARLLPGSAAVELHIAAPSIDPHPYHRDHNRRDHHHDHDRRDHNRRDHHHDHDRRDHNRRDHHHDPHHDPRRFGHDHRLHCDRFGAALGSWYVRIPSVSALQWHMFSAVASTIGDEADRAELVFLIKPLGGWTRRLKEQVAQATDSSAPASRGPLPPLSLEAGLEGPYGYESDFYLKYSALVLVGGGIGITPLLAVLRDVLIRHRPSTCSLAPAMRRVKLYHCVRTADELAVLKSLDPNELCPGHESRGLRISVAVYITRRPEIHESRSPTTNTIALDLAASDRIDSCQLTTPSIASAPITKHVVANTVTMMIGSKGEPLWVASTVLCSVVGFYIVWAAATVAIAWRSRRLLRNYEEAHLVLASMVVATLVFGGGVLWLWIGCSKCRRTYKTAERSLNKATDEKQKKLADVPGIRSRMPVPIRSDRLLMDRGNDEEETAVVLDRTVPATSSATTSVSPWVGTLHIGSRPCWPDIFRALAMEHRGASVGVLVSGPKAMQMDVALECRRHTKFFDIGSAATAFHYHSVSFEI